MRAFVICICGLLAIGQARADEATVAVATNFLGTAQGLQQAFAAQSAHRIVLVSGSTGQIYAQILNGAPYDVFLAADEERPRLLAQSGAGDPASVFTYAVGRLVLWSRQPDLATGAQLRDLGSLPVRHFAIADPAVAPYGAAAREVLQHTGSWDALRERIVVGQNIAQAFAMVETGNAELGLVALSQAVAYGREAGYTIVPESLHAPIRQDAILLARAARNPAAVEFMAFLSTSAAASLISRSGYGTQ